MLIGSILYALAGVTPCRSLPKKRMLLNAFFKSQFNYCPLVSMFYSRAVNSKINRIHEKCTRIIFNDKHSPFSELLKKDRSNDFFKMSFKAILNFNVLQLPEFTIPLLNSAFSGTKSISFLYGAHSVPRPFK